MTEKKRLPVLKESEVPIACNPLVFTREQRAAHAELGIHLLSTLPLQKQELEDGYLFVYEGNEELFITLARWCADEHRCCSWATFTLEMSPFSINSKGQLQLKMTSNNPEGKAFFTSAFAYIESLKGAAPDLFVEATGVITPPALSHSE